MVKQDEVYNEIQIFWYKKSDVLFQLVVVLENLITSFNFFYMLVELLTLFFTLLLIGKKAE